MSMLTYLSLLMHLKKSSPLNNVGPDAMGFERKYLADAFTKE